MPTDHTEKAFESAVTAHLLSAGYVAGDPARFDPKLALDPSTLVRFLQSSQPKEWARLAAIYGGEVESKVVGTIAREFDQRGMLECLRHVITDRKVLDRQLQDTIYQFEHAQGVVQRIDENSAQLGDALSAGAKIIIEED